jgi:hypothetical protein
MRPLVYLLIILPAAAVARERPDVVELLRSAGQLTLYSIHPYEERQSDWHRNATEEERKVERFHGRKVYGKIQATTPEVREKVRSAVLAAFSSIREGPPMLCFEPRHAICVQRGEAHFDLLLCRECENAAVIYFDKDIAEFREDFLPLGQDGFDVLNQLLDQKGIFRERPAKEEEPNQSPEPTPASHCFRLAEVI